MPFYSATDHQLKASLQCGAHGTSNSVIILEHVIDSAKERLQRLTRFRQVYEEVSRFRQEDVVNVRNDEHR